jgi:hypothetical protein
MLVISLLFDSKVIVRDFTAIREHKKGSVSIVTKIMAYSLFISIGLSMLF